MPKQAEFEEKTYEKYFGHELARRTRATFSAGQCAEFHLGFDEAFQVPWWAIQYLFPHLLPRIWSRLPGFALSELDDLAERIGQLLPPFRLNFFVQYKRPEHVSGRRGAEWKSWRRPYYRYGITAHQQAALLRIDQTSGGRAAVVYASPAFVENDRLFTLAESGGIIAASNIAPVKQMNGHARFTYVNPGGEGFAYSKPEKVTGPAFEEIMLSALEQEGVQFRDHIIRTAQDMEASLEDDLGKRIFVTARKAVVFLSGMENGEIEAGTIANALATIEAFCDAFDVSLYAIA